MSKIKGSGEKEIKRETDRARQGRKVNDLRAILENYPWVNDFECKGGRSDAK